MTRYDVDTLSEIVITCCILHNFLMNFDPAEKLIIQVETDLNNSVSERNFLDVQKNCV
ncbi:hypothetical protein AHAS_Ahas03G0097700 [Arachis hypogaea]